MADGWLHCLPEVLKLIAHYYYLDFDKDFYKVQLTLQVNVKRPLFRQSSTVFIDLLFCVLEVEHQILNSSGFIAPVIKIMLFK